MSLLQMEEIIKAIRSKLKHANEYLTLKTCIVKINFQDGVKYQGSASQN